MCWGELPGLHQHSELYSKSCVLRTPERSEVEAVRRRKLRGAALPAEIDGRTELPSLPRACVSLSPSPRLTFVRCIRIINRTGTRGKTLYIHSFQVAEGGTYIPQATTIDWLAKQYAKHSGLDAESAIRKISRFACSPTQIAQRKTFLPEWANVQPPETAVPRNLEQRMATYRQEMGKALEFVMSPSKLMSLPSHILHVSCTGYTAPSIAEEWVSRRLSENATMDAPIVQHLYHMGCYASVPALRTAHGLIAIEPAASVAIVHTEFCSLHVHAATAPEQRVVQSLFADAVVKYEATGNPPPARRSLRLLSTLERIAPASIDDMTWNLTSDRFDMTLSRHVPAKIRAHLPLFVKDLLERAGLSTNDLPHMIAAIHPGGPRIVDQVLQALGLDESQAVWSRKTLFEHGNVSSATLPLLWKSVLDDGNGSSRHVLCLAFGPGLTLAGAVLEWTEPGG